MAAVTVLALAAGCAGETGPSLRDSATVQRGGTVIVSGVIGDPSNGFIPRNPKSSSSSVVEIMAPLWRGVWLVTPDSRFELNRGLVESAELVSTEPQTAVYKINPKAVWSDGVPVSAADLIYNWQAGRSGALDIDGSPLQAGVSSRPITSVTGSEHGRTVTAVFSERYARWKSGFTPFNILVPAHTAKRVGWNTGFDRFDPTLIVSSGPFRIESYNPGRDLTLVRNERYSSAPANLDRIVLRFTSDAKMDPRVPQPSARPPQHLRPQRRHPRPGQDGAERHDARHPRSRPVIRRLQLPRELPRCPRSASPSPCHRPPRLHPAGRRP